MTINIFEPYKLTEANQLEQVFKVSIIEAILHKYQKSKWLALDKAVNNLIWSLQLNQLSTEEKFLEVGRYMTAPENKFLGMYFEIEQLVKQAIKIMNISVFYKKLIIENVLHNYKLSKWGRHSENSEYLIQALESDQLNEDQKFFQIYLYMNDSDNKSRLLYFYLEDAMQQIYLKPKLVSRMFAGIIKAEHISNLDEAAKTAIINSFLLEYTDKIEEGRSLSTLWLLKNLQNKNRSINGKWEDVLKYCEDSRNHESILYSIIISNIKKELPLFYNKSGEHYFLDGNFDLASQSFNKAIEIGEEFSHSNKNNFYSNAGRSLEKSIMKGAYQAASINFFVCSRKKNHNSKIFRNEFANFIRPVARTNAHSFLNFELPVFLKSIIGAIVGMTHVFTRNILEAADLNKLFENISYISANACTFDRQEMLTTIINNYNAEKSSSSTESRELYNDLTNNMKSLNTKWNVLVKYMTASEVNTNFFKNNGKKMFCIVDKVIANYIEKNLDSVFKPAICNNFTPA